MSLVDLSELANRESERVEWKLNVADPSKAVRTIVAFANDYSNLGGGYIVCGAEEIVDKAGFQAVNYIGMTSDRCKEIEGIVLSHCREHVDPEIVPVVDEIETEDEGRRILVFIIAATGQAHSYRSDKNNPSTYYIRIGRETREAKNGLLRELLVKKGNLEAWDRRGIASSEVDDLDLIALREHLQGMGLWDSHKPVEDYLSDTKQLSPFVPPLTVTDGLQDVRHPRNFAMLLFSNNPTRYITSAYCVYSVYPGVDRSESESQRVDITGDIVGQARKLLGLIDVESFTAFDKEAPNPNQQKYPMRALQEAIVNAVVHRDYEINQPVRVTVFADRVEVYSPGSLPRAIDKDKFQKGHATPYWRNQSLAYFFSKLQLAQAEGQGIPTIIRTMEEMGSPHPVFELGEESVTVVLPAHPRHKLLRQIRNIENEVILGKYEDALSGIDEVLVGDSLNYRAIEMLCEVANLQGRPDYMYERIDKYDLDIERLNPATRIMIAETLLVVDRGNETMQSEAKRILKMASMERLEEKELKRVAIALRKMGKDEEAVNIIDTGMKQLPGAQMSAALYDIRAKAKIDLAKRCMETARNRKLSPVMKGRAWDECRRWLSSAENDLGKALETVDNSYDREYIEKDVEFLKHLQDIAKKPPARYAKKRNGRGSGYKSGRAN